MRKYTFGIPVMEFIRHNKWDIDVNHVEDTRQFITVSGARPS